MQKLIHIVSMIIIFFASITSVKAEGEYTYKLVESNDDIVDGGVYLLKAVGGDDKDKIYYASEFGTNAITCNEESDGVITNPYLITLHADQTKPGTFFINHNTEYLTVASGPKLNTRNQTGYDDNYNWLISIDNNSKIIIKENNKELERRLYYAGLKNISINPKNKFETLYLYRQVPANTSVDVTVSSASYASFCSTQALDFTDSGIEAYYATLNGTTLNLNRINRVPSNTGLILYKENGTDAAQSINPCEGETESAEGNCLTASTANKTVAEDETIYVLSTMDGETAFYPAATGLEIPAGKAYIQLNGNTPESASAKPLTFSFMLPTAITKLQRENTDGAFCIDGASYHTDCASFSIDGKPAEAGYRGIIIKDGKKILTDKK